MRNIKKIQMAVFMFLFAVSLAACSSNATPTTSSSTTTAPEVTTTIAGTQPSASETGGVTATTSQGTFMPASSNQTPTAEPNSTPAATPVAVIDANLKTNINIWSALSGSQSQLLNDQVKQFSKAYPGVKINVTTYNPDELGAEFLTAAKTGNGPDLVLTTSDFVSNFESANLVQPVESLINTKIYTPNSLSPSNLGGKQYGVPYIYGNTLVLAYNKKLVPTPPTDTNQLIQMAQQIQKEGGKGKQRMLGMVMDLNEPYDLTPWVYGFGGTLLDANNQPTLDSAGMTQALQFMYDLGYKDKIAQPNYEPTRNQADYEFRDGTLAFFITTDKTAMNYASTSGTSSPPTARDPNGVGLDLGIAPLPKVSATGKYATPFTDSEAFFVSTKTSGDHLTASKDFLTYISTPEQQTYMATRYRLLPPTLEGLNSAAVKDNPALNGIASQLALAIPQPTQSQMQAVWSALRPNLEQVIGGVIKPASAAQAMQEAVQTEIKAAGTTQP